MTSVYTAFRLDNPVEGDIGLEIEVEGVNLPSADKYWRNERDGSLRAESTEYVLKKPLTLADAKKALDYLDYRFKLNDTQMDESVRAGVHVHVNVQQLEVVQLVTFITLYLVLEELLIKFCGPNREGNLFCLRAKDARYLISYLRNSLETKKLSRLVHDNIRYASINLKALGDYGSLEFRAMRSTRDFNLIHLWTCILHHLKEVSLSFANPVEVVCKVSERGPEAFTRDVLGEYFEHFEAMPIGECIRNGVDNAQDVAYAVDWEEYDSGCKKNPFRPRFL